MKCVEANSWFTPSIQIKLLIILDHYWTTFNPALQGCYRPHASIGLVLAQRPEHKIPFLCSLPWGRPWKSSYYTTAFIRQQSKPSLLPTMVVIFQISKRLYRIYAMLYLLKRDIRHHMNFKII